MTTQRVKKAVPWWERYSGLFAPIAGILIVSIVMLVFEPRFFQFRNLMLILESAAIFMVLGMALTIVITGAGIDLSMGSVMALSGVIMAMLMKDFGWNPYLAMMSAVVVGTACGFINGVVIAKLKVPDLITTLSTDLVFRGTALVLAAGAVLFGMPEPIPTLGRGKLFGFLPISAVIGLTVLLVGYIIYRYTKLGRYAIAIGGNREAAMLAGIKVDNNKIYHYMLMGFAAGIAAIMLTGRLDAIQATSGMLVALHTIAAVIVGGTNLFGGRGSMTGTLAGTLLLSMIVNALVTLRFAFFWQGVFSGIIIIGSVAFYVYLQRRGTGVRA